MPNLKNQSQVKELESKLDNVQAIFLADYAGLALKDQRSLRAKVKAAGGELVVAKNTLLKIALKNKGYDADAISEFLKGPSITLFAHADAVAPLKAMVEFSKANEAELPKLKSGILGKETLSITKVMQLATLPSKAELIAKLLGTLSNPARNLVGILSAPIRYTVYALNAIKDQKSKSN